MFQRLKDYIRERILTIQVKDLYNTIDEDDILKRVGTDWTVAGKPVSEQYFKRIVSEAELLKKSELWRVLKADIRYRANKRMFEESTSTMDLTMGKMWLYTLDTIDTKLNNLTK